MKMKSKKREESVYLKIIIAIVILIISIFIIAQNVNIVEKVLVSYNTDSKIDYKVFLYPNDYIKSEYMEKGKTYITNLVNKLSLDFDYKLSSSDALNNDYRYDIVAKITVKHNSTGKELWTEEIKLADDKNVIVSDKKNIAIKDSVEIPYKEYNDKVRNFKSQLNIPITAYLDINLIVKDKDNINKKISTTGISMDLNEDTFEINEVATGKGIENITENSNPNKKLLIVVSSIAVLSSLYILVKIYNLLNSSMVKKSYYSKAIYKILKNYGDIVAELVKPVDLSGLKIIDVKNFDQMLDVEEELRIPIMFYETIKNEEGYFVLVHQDMAYRYILRDKFKK